MSTKKLRIKSIQELKDWNSNAPIEPKPIVLEWYLDWFFEQLNASNKKEALDSIDVMIAFGMKVEGYTREESRNCIIGNLSYYSGHAAHWRSMLKELLRDSITNS